MTASFKIRRILSILTIMLLMAGVAACSKDNSTRDKSSVSSDTENVAAVKVDTKVVKKDEAWISIEANIPVVTGINNENVQKLINDMLEDAGIKFVNNLEQQSKEALEYAKTAGYDYIPYYAGITFEEKFNRNGILSLYVVYDQYTGGAHGSHDDITYNFDLATGEIIPLSELFNEDYNYAATIDKNITAQIEKMNKQYRDEAIKNGENPDDAYAPYSGFNGIANDQQYYIKGGSIVIYFPLYEIAPYAAGIPEFEIHLSEIESGIKAAYLQKLK
ncbi:hypothetical protein EAL2_808p07160 (plasmid) [Peptoclostridium acidaminophilum DSM 3953]|uniref:DUF3298 domain-containing protein n=1 Tax=Peptoclostridium acidaminophilum DSM 3953 TaxID=1286171 RepID=W8T982_PEPAC|nr:DUF3298 and DUF4163 domain-containing protein [Peptoclostridium acidaminophilum]AHM58219.1 hypothetical protein EAL2_808p07160 [Peptoclostridium acidaminophilum DSM 3953]